MISRRKCGESLWAIRSSSDGMNEDSVLRSSEIQNNVIFTNLKWILSLYGRNLL